MLPADMSDESLFLDATGLKCPLPVLRARKLIMKLAPGGVLEVLATDRAAPVDFEAFCRETGHVLLASERDGDVYRLRIERKPDRP